MNGNRKINKAITMFFILILVSCSGSKSRVSTDENGHVTSYQEVNQKTIKQIEIEQSRRQCYESIARLEQQKAATNPALLAMINRRDITTDQLLIVSMVIQNTELTNKLIPEETPFSCDGMNANEFQLARSEIRHKFWSKFTSNAMKYGVGYLLGDEIIDGLSRDTIAAGSGAVINSGSGSLDQSDRSDRSTTDNSDNSQTDNSDKESGDGNINE